MTNSQTFHHVEINVGTKCDQSGNNCKEVVVGSRVVIHDLEAYTDWLINPDNHRDE